MTCVSVIIPVYQVKQYLDRCLKSVLNQTFTDYEIILVDDGSTDGSQDICDKYASEYDHITVVHKQNGGLSSARNTGIDFAKGEYIVFVDSDDVIHPDCLKVFIECVSNSEAEIVIGEFQRFKENELELQNLDSWDKKIICKDNIDTLNTFFDGSSSLHSIVSACGTLWKTSLFEGIRFPEKKLFEDEFTTYKLYYKAKKIAFINFRLYYYFVNNNGITGTLTLEKRFDEYDAQWERLLFFEEKGLTTLRNKAALLFLKTAQWDLIKARDIKTPALQSKIKRFEQQYRDAFIKAVKTNNTNFIKDYDYYVLALPEWSFLFRLKKFIILRFKIASNHK